MDRTTGGDKRSSWLVFQRRLFVVRRLVRGDAPAGTIIAEARAALGDEIYPQADRTALQKDIAALRAEFGCEITYAAERGYHLADPGNLAILDLPDDELEALAFLRSTFADTQMPNAPQVSSLLSRITRLLPDRRQRDAERQRALPRFDRPETVTGTAAETVAALKRHTGQQQIQFDYCSTFVPSGTSVRHRVSPYDLLYRDGHMYLDAFCHTANDSEVVERYHLYRVDRIVPGSVRALPTRLPPARYPQRLYPLRYTLSPSVAGQGDVACWFPHSQVVLHPDGSATISAQVSDLWQARQVLLRYREHCCVHEPHELVEMIRQSLQRMLAIYSAMQSEGAPCNGD